MQLALLDREGPEFVPGRAAFQARLDALAPRDSGLSWLLLVWQPGDSWQPVHRWLVYQMIPERFVPEHIRQSLDGPHPRIRGRWDALGSRFWSDPRCLVDLTQWTLWQRFRALARPYWVIQGERGGHRRRFSYQEKLSIYMETGQQDVEPAAPGDLGYAAPDERVIAALEQRDQLARYGKILQFATENPDFFSDVEMQEIMAIRERLWQHLEGQVEDAIAAQPKAMFKRAADEIFEHGRIEDVDWQEQLELHHEQFVTEGGMV